MSRSQTRSQSPHKKAGGGPVEKASIPKALREQVWITYAGRRFERRCLIPWCKNTMTVFDFHVGHNVPESVGGATEIANLRPICARCNLSMGANYSITEWSALSKPKRSCWFRRRK
jgi:5-methylcytosine-specific restriction endonuclease McrA